MKKYYLVDLHTFSLTGISCIGVMLMECDLCRLVDSEVAVKIKDAKICKNCEAKIVSVNVWDPEYQMWINRINKFWQHLLGEKEYA